MVLAVVHRHVLHVQGKATCIKKINQLLTRLLVMRSLNQFIYLPCFRKQVILSFRWLAFEKDAIFMKPMERKEGGLHVIL